ncbi:MAG TPA: hypothetical protein PKA63_03325 [Oligoflexia bacterium]|nr:hypothetical protein [Oligoflexia bacterium]HMP47686.1 hypothetical protein [Oligoflexia bacterium]
MRIAPRGVKLPHIQVILGPKTSDDDHSMFYEYQSRTVRRDWGRMDYHEVAGHTTYHLSHKDLLTLFKKLLESRFLKKAKYLAQFRSGTDQVNSGTLLKVSSGIVTIERESTSLPWKILSRSAPWTDWINVALVVLSGEIIRGKNYFFDPSSVALVYGEPSEKQSLAQDKSGELLEFGSLVELREYILSKLKDQGHSDFREVLPEELLELFDFQIPLDILFTKDDTLLIKRKLLILRIEETLETPFDITPHGFVDELRSEQSENDDTFIASEGKFLISDNLEPSQFGFILLVIIGSNEIEDPILSFNQIMDSDLVSFKQEKTPVHKSIEKVASPSRQLEPMELLKIFMEGTVFPHLKDQSFRVLEEIIRA